MTKISRRAGLVALGLAFTVAACGFRTDPRPPEATAPVIAGRLEAQRTDAGVKLKWKRATESADGATLVDLEGFVVERSIADGPYAVIANVPVTDGSRIRQRKSFSWTDTSSEMSAQYRVRAVLRDGQQGEPIGPARP